MVEARSFSAAPIHSILVPLDGSRLAESAIPAAVALAKPARAVITLFHVLETDPPNSIHGEPHLSRQDEAIAYLEALSARFQESGVVISIHVHEDPEKDVSLSIVNHSEELDVSLIVLANHGTGGIRGFFFGRVAQQIVQRGKKPVIAVPTIEPLFAHTRFNRLALLLNRTTESEAAIPISARLATEFSASLHLICAVPTIGTLAEDRSASATLLPSAARELLNIEVQDTHRYLGGIASQLTRLLLHLLKWQYQPQRRSDSWLDSITDARTQIDLAIQDSPSLKGYPAEQLEDSYRRARRQAATQTKLEISTFPETCQHAIDLVLAEDWLPQG